MTMRSRSCSILERSERDRDGWFTERVLIIRRAFKRQITTYPMNWLPYRYKNILRSYVLAEAREMHSYGLQWRRASMLEAVYNSATSRDLDPLLEVEKKNVAQPPPKFATVDESLQKCEN